MRGAGGGGGGEDKNLVGMSKFSASGERTPPHLPSRKNPVLDRILILGGLLVKREVTFFKGETVFTKK